MSRKILHLRLVFLFCLMIEGSATENCRAWKRTITTRNVYGVVVFTKTVGPYPECPEVCYQVTSCNMFAFNLSTSICIGFSAYAARFVEGTSIQLNDYYVSVGTQIYTFDTNLNVSFAVYKTKKNWQDAKRVCIADGGGLITFSNKDKENIRSHIDIGYYWIGLSDRVNEGNWVWDNGDEFDERSWDFSFNDYDSGVSGAQRHSADCAIWFSPGSSVHDVNCVETTKHFICEKNL